MATNPTLAAQTSQYRISGDGKTVYMLHSSWMQGPSLHASPKPPRHAKVHAVYDSTRPVGWMLEQQPGLLDPAAAPEHCGLWMRPMGQEMSAVKFRLVVARLSSDLR